MKFTVEIQHTEDSTPEIVGEVDDQTTPSINLVAADGSCTTHYILNPDGTFKIEQG